jgi:hypothetical protein
MCLITMTRLEDLWSKYDFYMLICCFLYYVQNVPYNNAYMFYRTYIEELQKQGAHDVERRLAVGFPKWFESHVCD